MKKILFIVAVALVALTACQKGQVKETVYSVDEVFVQGDSLVGDTISVEGMCLHLCKHGGQFIRANAVAFESFAPECVNNKVRVRGMLRAVEVPVEVKEAEESHEEGEEACSVCSTVKKFYIDADSYQIILPEQ